MKLRLIVISCVLVGAMGVAFSQQPDSKTTPLPKAQVKAARHGKTVRRQRQVHSQMPVTASNAVAANVSPSAKQSAYTDALRRYRRERHDRFWWRNHFRVIVLVGGGYYYWDSGYWCPAWGYDPAYQYYDYDGPIYTYGNLLPDQVVANVQRVLKQLGYYGGEITGSLGPATRAAIAGFQEDYGLDPIGVVDAPTVAALGLV